MARYQRLFSRFILIGAIACLLGFPVAVLGFRLQLWNFGMSFTLLQWTLIGSVLFFIGALVLYFLTLKHRPDVPHKIARATLLLLLLPIMGLGSQALKARSVPRIHDISTDLLDPPRYQVIVELRGDNSNALDKRDNALNQQQQAAYPHLKTIKTTSSPDQAFGLALQTAKDLSWDVVSQDITQGIIEAVDTSLLFGFKDDIVIRIRGNNTGSLIDLRSVSRIGRSDLGANAERIGKFIEAMRVE